MIVKDRAKGKSQHELEDELLKGNASGKQWTRWKGGQLPAVAELQYVTGLAVARGWMDAHLGDLLCRSYGALRSSDSSSSREYEESSALKACFDYAEKVNDKDLLDACSDWERWFYGPDEGTAEFEAWLTEKASGWAIEDQENVLENISLLVTKVIAEVYAMGVDDPIQAISNCLRAEKKGWATRKREIDEDKFSRKNEIV